MNDFSGIDPAGLARLERMGGRPFVKEMIDLFLEEAPERLAAARHSEQAGDVAAVGEAAHALKSSARNFGATGLANIAEDIEMSVHAGQPGNLSTKLNDLEQAFSAAKSWLESQRTMFTT